MKLSFLNLFFTFIKLGLISFGGPIAHLSFFYREFVTRQKILDEQTYMDLVVLCQSLPGPASSQVAIAIGMTQRGIAGGIISIIAFLLPSIILMILAGYALSFFATQLHAGWLHGLKIAVLAVIAQAILQMSQRFCSDWPHIFITIIASVIAALFVGFIGQIAAILIGVLGGHFFVRKAYERAITQIHSPLRIINTRMSVIAWFLFLILLFGTPILNANLNAHALTLFDGFYRTGALVFGGGHVILPLLESQLVTTGLIDNNTFLAGYGIAQALPGPLFSFAAFLGTVIKGFPSGWLGGLFCVFAIYLPSLLILMGVLPIWDKWRQHPAFQSLLAGVGAAVVGLLIAAFYDPIWITTIQSSRDLIMACIAFFLLEILRWPQWFIVLLCVLSSILLSVS